MEQRVAGVCLFGLLAACAAGAAPLEPEPDSVELYFELKLLIRTRSMMRRVEVDQWAGGRLLMRRDGAGRDALELVRPIEDPWTFRWYPTKDEVKLGAAVWIAEPSGDPYSALAERIAPLARLKYAEWWDADRAGCTAPVSPPWQSRASRFWAARHAEELEEKDPLHAEPVYPFYVLGDPAGRFVFSLDDGLGVVADSISERMSSPWLATGWSEWIAGSHRAGYGYWERERPDWEPATYPSLAAAVRLLGWSPFAGPPSTMAALGDGSTYTLVADRSVSLPSLAGQVVGALLPRTRSALDWGGLTPFEFTVGVGSGGTTVTGSTSGLRVVGDSRVGYRGWRHAELDGTGDTLRRDELQLWFEHDDGQTVKLWIRIGYRPYPDPLVDELPPAP